MNNCAYIEHNFRTGEIMAITDNLHIMIKVCQMYYIGGLSQKEISDQLGISRSQISRILTSANENNIVSVKINNPFEDETRIEKELVSRYKIRDALVLRLNSVAEKARLDEFGKMTADYLNALISDNSRIGVMSGQTISQLVHNITHISHRGLEIVPLMGGLGFENSGLHANSIAQRFAEISGGKNYVLNAPVIVQSRQSKEILLQEPEIASVLELGKHCDLTIVGIGQINDASTTAIAGKWTESDIAELQKAGAAASVCNSFLGKDGEIIHVEIGDRTIGQTLETISTSQTIGVAYGSGKVDAIRATILSGYLDVLITDIETAKEILKMK